MKGEGAQKTIEGMRRAEARICARTAASILWIAFFAVIYQLARGPESTSSELAIFEYGPLQATVGRLFVGGLFACLPVYFSVYMYTARRTFSFVTKVRLLHAFHIFAATVAATSLSCFLCIFTIIFVPAMFASFSEPVDIVGVFLDIGIYSKFYSGIIGVCGIGFMAFSFSLASFCRRLDEMKCLASWKRQLFVVVIVTAVISMDIIYVQISLGERVDVAHVKEIARFLLLVSPLLFVNMFAIGRLHKRWRLDYSSIK